jgi:hypothetical protein
MFRAARAVPRGPVRNSLRSRARTGRWCARATFAQLGRPASGHVGLRGIMPAESPCAPIRAEAIGAVDEARGARRGGAATPGSERRRGGELAAIGVVFLEKLNGTVNALAPCRCTMPMRESSVMGRYSSDPYPGPGNWRQGSARGFAHMVISVCAKGGAGLVYIPCPKSLTPILHSLDGAPVWRAWITRRMTSPTLTAGRRRG